MVDEGIRNFRDFLQLYNVMSEECFKRCVDNFNGRSLEDTEGTCVEDCASKFIKLNHKLMRSFVQVQGILMNKRVQEMQQQNEALQNAENNIPSPLGNSNVEVQPDVVVAT